MGESGDITNLPLEKAGGLLWRGWSVLLQRIFTEEYEAAMTRILWN